MTRLSTPDFQVGDRVRFTLGSKNDLHNGNEGEVRDVINSLIYVNWDQDTWMFKNDYNRMPFNKMHHELVFTPSNITEPSEDIYNDLI